MSLRLVAVALFSFLTSLAQSADLLSLYREAIDQDPGIAAARAQVQAAQERHQQAKSSLGPQATASVGANYNYGGVNIAPVGLAPSINRDRLFLAGNAAVSASQPLYRKTLIVNAEQAEEAIKQAEINVASLRQDLIVRLTQAYFDVLLAEDNIVLLGAQKAAVSLQLDQAKRNFEVGTATIVDTNEAQARYDQVLAQEITLQNELESRRWALRSIIGRYEAVLKKLRDPIDLTSPQPNSMEAWVTRAEADAFSVRIARQALALLEYDVKRQQGLNDWTVDLVGSAATTLATGTATSAAGQHTRSAAVGLALTYPLFTNGLNDARIREALANLDKARQDVEAARRAIALASRQAFLGVNNGIASIRAQQQALTSANTLLASTKLGLEVGVRTNLDVLNAQQQVFTVRRDLAAARYNTIMSGLRLRSTTGTLDEPDVRATNGYLQ